MCVYLHRDMTLYLLHRNYITDEKATVDYLNTTLVMISMITQSVHFSGRTLFVRQISGDIK